MFKNSHSKLLNIIFVTFFLIIFNSFQIYSQLRPRTNQDSILAQMNIVWYNQPLYQFHQNFPILNYLPPATTDMPYQTLLSYLFLDSLCRTFTSDSIRNHWNCPCTANDTIRLGIKYLYLLNDYDPIRFFQYGVDADPQYYKSNPKYIYSFGYKLINSVVQDLQNKRAFIDLLTSDYILRVSVNNVQSMPWINHPGKNIYRVNATVLDTLHGRVYPNRYIPNNVNKINLSKDLSNQLVSGINFNYATGPYQGGDRGNIIDNTLKDTLGNLSIQPGQDLLVVLKLGHYLWDFNNDYFCIDLISALPIINGQIIDHSKEWSNNEVLNYNDWKQAFIIKLNVLLNGGY